MSDLVKNPYDRFSCNADLDDNLFLFVVAGGQDQ